jgi:predicted permease
MSLWSRIRNVFRGDAVNRELEDELRAHLEEAAERGRSTEEARRAFGNRLLHREYSRDEKLLPWLDSLRADIVFGWRQLRKNRTISIAAVLSLALGIGSCVTAFRLIDAVLLRPLPVAGAQSLYYLAYGFLDSNGKPEQGDSFSYPQYRELRDIAKDKADLMVISYAGRQDVTYGTDADMEKAYRQFVSGHTMSVFGLKPIHGRILTPADDVKPGGHPVAVLSYDYWTRRFGSDPKAVGKTFRQGEDTYEIVGVLEKGFTGTETGTMTDFFVPAMMNAKAIENPNWGWMRVWVKLKSGVTAEQARQPLQASFTNHRRERAKVFSSDAPKKQIDEFVNAPVELLAAEAGASGAQKSYRQPLMILGVVAALVLLIACVNVANLLTAQAAARSREMALRMSIGAGRWRLLQLMLVEGAMLASLATLFGALFAWWSAPFVVSKLNPPDNPMRLVLDADWRVAAFGMTLAIVVTLLFGLAPALRASAIQPISALKGGEDPHARRRLMNSLVAAQVAFCFLVHFTAGLFVSTFDRLSHQPVGFTPEGLLLLETSVKAGAKQPKLIWRQIGDRLQAINGVESVSIASWGLMSGNGWSSDVRVANRDPEAYSPYFLGVSPGWLQTMRIPIIDGRDFRPEDVAANVDEKTKQAREGVAIVNEEFARHYFNGENPVGKTYESLHQNNVRVRTQIVGYVRDARYRTMREAIRATAYVPVGEESDWGTFIVRVKSGTELLSLATPLRQEVARVRTEFRVSNVRAQTELVQQHTIRERMLAMLSLFFAIVALILAGVGLYGVLNYSVIQRTREIGIRMALGARPVNVIRKVTTEVFGMLLLGSAIGLGAGIASERYLEKLLFQVKVTDTAIVAMPIVALIAAGILAALAPTIRAVRVDPAQALRAE